MVTINHLVRHRDFLSVTYRDSRILLTNKMRQNQQMKIVVQHLASVMLATILCWWLYDGDRFKILVTDSRCWWQIQYVGNYLHYVGYFSMYQTIIILDGSPTSQNCHQHISSPTSLANVHIFVTKIRHEMSCKICHFWSVFEDALVRMKSKKRFGLYILMYRGILRVVPCLTSVNHGWSCFTALFRYVSHLG